MEGRVVDGSSSNAGQGSTTSRATSRGGAVRPRRQLVWPFMEGGERVEEEGGGWGLGLEV